MNDSSNNILVVTASGFLGSTVTKQLLDQKYRVKAFVRASSRERIDSLVAYGAEPVIGDLKNTDSLIAACRGVDTIISSATAVVSQQPGDGIDTVDLEGQLKLIEAAESNGVGRFIYVSIMQQVEDFPLQSAKRAVEARLANSSLEYTILRPTFFQEVWLSPPLGFDYVEGRVRVYGNGEKAQNWISVIDVAQALVACLKNTSTVGQVVALNGPESLGANQIISIFESIAGRSYEKEYISEEFLAAQYLEASEPRQKSFFALARQNARGADSSATVARVGLPVATRTVRDYAKSVLQQPSGSN